MPVVTGKVEAISMPKKTWEGKFGGTVGHVGVKIGADWYNLPFHQVDKPVPVQQGQSVTFMFKEEERNGFVNRNIDKKTLEASGAPAPAAGKSAVASAVGGMSARDDYWRKKEEKDDVRTERIERQSARRDAIAAADVCITQGIVKLPAKQSDKYDVFLSLVEALTDRFVGSVTDSSEVVQEDEEEEQEPEDSLPF